MYVCVCGRGGGSPRDVIFGPEEVQNNIKWDKFGTFFRHPISEDLASMSLNKGKVKTKL